MSGDQTKDLGSQMAFPSGLAAGQDGGLFVSAEVAGCGGLTKRELFAAMAMEGLCHQPTMPIDGWAKMAVYQADELLKELAK
jgi:hypothetical protein